MARKKRSPSGSKRKFSKRTPQQSQIPSWVWLAGGSIALVVLVVGLFYLGNQGPTIANSGIEGLVILPDPGQGHQEGEVNYHDEVPAGGTHSSAWLNCGIYDQPIQEENVVHSMEHGAVWLAYQPDLPTGQVETLRNLVHQERSRRGQPLVVLAPKPQLDAPIVATAWRVQLNLNDASDERLGQFLSRYQQGPFTPEPGAPCFDGIGEPLG
ncbi:DUF3105 domain-containing protein [Chloroflexota bacterium]